MSQNLLVRSILERQNICSCICIYSYFLVASGVSLNVGNVLFVLRKLSGVGPALYLSQTKFIK